ncbi:flagellar biosynthetic protein FliR [Rhodobacteraceae bacterium XHP0102]|nr:flagellar biosynthetic protein FliR [Rhodobacteraceae bacterium XHP0102]
MAQTTLFLWFAVLLRLSGMFLVLPAFGEQMIPMRVRFGVVFALSLIMTPLLAASMGGLTAMPAVRVFFGEIIIGLILGMGLRLMIHALQIMGSIAAQATSLSMMAGGAMPDPQPAIGTLLMLAGLTLAVMTGLHLHIITMLMGSYEVLPLGSVLSGAAVEAWGTARVAHAFALGFSLAAPFVLTATLYNLALGVINRAMPQMMVAFVGAPAIAFGGLLLMFIISPFALAHWQGILIMALQNPLADVP